MSVLTCGSVIVAMELFRLRMSLDEAAEENARHEIAQPGRIDLAGRDVPVVDPVHHPEQDVSRRTAIDRALVRRRLFENRLEQVDILSLDRAHRPRRRLMRDHLHLSHVLREERHVMVYEGMQLFLRVTGGRHGLASAVQDLREAALLDEREQVFLAADVVVHPCQGHPARRGEVPHGRGMVALVRKDPSGAGEQMVETLVVWSHDFERSFELRSYPRGPVLASPRRLNIATVSTSTDKRTQWRILCREPM